MLDQHTLQAEKIHFWRNGFVVVRGMFEREEMAIVKRKILEIQPFNARVERLRKQQQEGEHPSFETIFVWNDVDGNDLFAKIGRSNKILDRLSYFYDDDVYDYHNKIALKYPGIVGFRGHQDHAYWQHYGCRFPEAHAVFIAIDAAHRSNGCLKVIPQSHLLGTLPHGTWTGRGSDNGVLPEVLEKLFKTGYQFEAIETEPGDAILFHGNTIHGSDDNNSDEPRIAMIATMNTKRNSPDPRYNKPGHPYWSHQARVTSPISLADLALPLPDFDKRFEAEQLTVVPHSQRASPRT